MSQCKQWTLREVWLASFPASRAGEEEREPGTHCSHMCQVPLVTCILLCYSKITVKSVYLLKGRTSSSPPLGFAHWTVYVSHGGAHDHISFLPPCLHSMRNLNQRRERPENKAKKCISSPLLSNLGTRLSTQFWLTGSIPHVLLTAWSSCWLWMVSMAASTPLLSRQRTRNGWVTLKHSLIVCSMSVRASLVLFLWYRWSQSSWAWWGVSWSMWHQERWEVVQCNYNFN